MIGNLLACGMCGGVLELAAPLAIAASSAAITKAFNVWNQRKWTQTRHTAQSLKPSQPANVGSRKN